MDLLPDERTDTHVRCRICGKWVTYKRSRLFAIKDGDRWPTIRTCSKGDSPHGPTIDRGRHLDHAGGGQQASTGG